MYGISYHPHHSLFFEYSTSPGVKDFLYFLLK
jgi:hypothetical protein